MSRELTTDLKVVYYRGRYWTAITCSKVEAPGVDRAPKAEARSDGEAVGKH